MSQEKIDFNWFTCSDHYKEMIKNLMISNESADVTLMCDDKTKFKAHKFVLKACSPVFQNIISDISKKEDIIIYLRGVPSQEMESILKFVYLGKATIYQDRMYDFLSVARNLEIIELSQHDIDNKAKQDKQEHNEFIKSDNEEESNDQDSMFDVNVKYEHTDTKNPSNMLKTVQYSCSKCKKLFTRKSGLKRHIRSSHEGIQFPCYTCDKSFSQKFTLATHILDVHEGAEFQCNHCDFKTTRRWKLEKHKLYNHYRNTTNIEVNI